MIPSSRLSWLVPVRSLAYSTLCISHHYHYYCCCCCCCCCCC